MCTIIPRGNGVCFLFDLFVLSRTVTTLHDIGGHNGKPVVPLFVMRLQNSTESWNPGEAGSHR